MIEVAEELKGRSMEVLTAVIEDYIQSAEPVGSRTIAKKHHFNVSSATIRNVMADLEEMGYLKQPHASAGRIPTEKGLRFYVDSILKIRKLSKREKKLIESRYEKTRFNLKDIKELFRETSKILSVVSKHPSLVMVQKEASAIFKHIEFIRLKERLVLAIFVTDSGLVENKIIQVDEELTQDELDRYTRYLNDLLQGLTLRDVRQKIVTEMKKERIQFNRLFSKALKLSQTAFEETLGEDIYIEGTKNFLNYPEFSADLKKMRSLFEAFEKKAILVRLLDRALQAGGIKIFIGSENEFSEMVDCSLVTTTYKKASDTIGTLGVIGPTRMDYSKVIPIVDYTGKVLSRILEKEV